MGLLNNNVKKINFFFFYFSGLQIIFLNFFKVFNRSNSFFNTNFFFYKKSTAMHLNNANLNNKIFFLSSAFFFLYDYVYLYSYFNYFKSSNHVKQPLLVKFKQLLTFNKNTPSNQINLKLGSLLYGLQSIWKLFRNWVLGLIFFFLIFYFLTYIRLLPINKVLFEWFLIVMFLYWLISGFVFFYKKYQFSKYTTVIQRFWKRTYILFWIIESGVFLVYFFLTLNSSEEPVYMYDQLKLYKTHFFSWRLFIIKLLPVVTLILVGYYLQLSLKWSTFKQQSYILLLITILLVSIFWAEFYQFFHIINFYGNLNWIFDYDDFTWNLELEFRRTRLANNYISICLIAKFWHLVFIFIFWIFFILRVNESKRVRYPLLAANVQNFIILYIMSWLYMYPWLKFIFKNFLENSFFWFMTNNRSLLSRLFFTELKLFIHSGIFNWFYLFKIDNFNFSFKFFYYLESSSITNYLHFKKHFLKDYIIFNLN